MTSTEPKKLAVLRIWQILREHSDADHLLTHEDILHYLERDYGIVLERKAVGRNLRLLEEAELGVETSRVGSYLCERAFEDSELRMLIDGVLSSKYISAKHSKDLIDKLCRLSNRFFRSHVKNVYSVNDWSKTDNQSLFYNIDLIDEAIEQHVQLRFDFNKYGVDKKLHKSSSHRVTPYQLILRNQRYYLMAHNEHFHQMIFFRVDHITNMQLEPRPATPLQQVPGFEGGINYKHLATLPYMFTDPVETVELIADKSIVDQIVDWFGTDIAMTEVDEHSVNVRLQASPAAMKHWAIQYGAYVQVTAPAALRDAIRDELTNALNRYS